MISELYQHFVTTCIENKIQVSLVEAFFYLGQQNICYNQTLELYIYSIEAQSTALQHECSRCYTYVNNSHLLYSRYNFLCKNTLVSYFFQMCQRIIQCVWCVGFFPGGGGGRISILVQIRISSTSSQNLTKDFLIPDSENLLYDLF